MLQCNDIHTNTLEYILPNIICVDPNSIKNGQSRETGNKTKKNKAKTQHNTTMRKQ